ncbi:MAG: NAD(P)-dependent alcohol dehydrogenase [Clostridiales Family XIII bacterium]|jgi:aryl-alcohol dehydrogenase|nr:NAD(P)-dependent alcohol dehydrogenase [Clostridiales Family XIII bacterium]
MKIQAAITREKGKLSIESAELAEPKAGEVLVRLVACGICHTDTAVIEQFLPVTFPMVAGHEGAGVVESVGPGVSDIKPGDRVIMTFPSCGICDSCKAGHPYACEKNFELFFFGNYIDGTKRITTEDGKQAGAMFGQASFATHAIASERNTIKADVSGDDELKELCSLGCGVQTGAGAVLNRIKPRPGSSIAVFGMGTVGLAAVMAAKIAGCGTIIAVHGRRGKELALDFGATHTINGRDGDAAAKIREITNGKGVNCALECAGVPETVGTMLDSMAKEGTAILVSVTADAALPIRLEPQIMNPSVTLAGAVEGCSNPKVFIPELVKFYKEGRLPVNKLNTFYKFGDIEQAFKDSHGGAVIKPILLF